MLSHFILEVANLINQLLFLLLLFVFVVVHTLLQSELGLLEPGQGVRVLLHVPFEVL